MAENLDKPRRGGIWKWLFVALGAMVAFLVAFLIYFEIAIVRRHNRPIEVARPAEPVPANRATE